MFGHIFFCKLKELAHKPWCIGWNLMFPIVLATAFYIGFGNFITDAGELAKVDVAVVEAPETAEPLSASTKTEMTGNPEKTELTAASGETQGFTQLVKELDFLNAHVVSEDEAEKLLAKGEVAGILYAPGAGTDPSDRESGNPSLVVAENGLDQTILSQFVRSYIIQKREVETVMAKSQDPETRQDAVRLISEGMTYGSDDMNLRYSEDETALSEDTGSGHSESSPYMHYFFALIAMACLYGSWLSANVLHGVKADQSELGKRFECAPVSRLTTITASIFAGLIFQILCVTALILFIQYVLGLSFGAPPGLIILISAAGSMAGVSFGVMFGALFGRSSAALTAIPLIFSMACSFLSGLMIGNMQQIVEVKAPWLNRINPAAVLAGGLDELCTYGPGKAYAEDLAVLIVMSVVTMLISSLALRRKSYASL